MRKEYVASSVVLVFSKFKNKKLIVYTKNLRVTHKLLSMNTQLLSYQSKVPIHLLIHDIISRAMQGVTRTCQLQPLQCVEFLENQNELDCLTIQNFCVKLPPSVNRFNINSQKKG